MVEYRRVDISEQQPDRVIVGKMLYAAIGKGDDNDAMFCSENWGHCNSAIVAEDNGEIVGVVTFTIKGRYHRDCGDIAIVYIKPSHRGQGIAKHLFLEAVKSLTAEAPERPIVVDPLHEHMIQILNGLSDELKKRIKLP